MDAELFANMLTFAVRRISQERDLPVGDVHSALGASVQRSEWLVPYLRKGHIPAWRDLEKLAQGIVERSSLPRPWMEQFLAAAGYPGDLSRALCERLYSPPPNPDASLQMREHRDLPSAPAPEWLARFVVGQPIFYPRQFYGRRRILADIFALLDRAPLQHIAIVGKKRSGKTSLLQYLQTIVTAQPDALRPGQRSDWLRPQQQIRWAYVDFQDARMQEQEGLTRHILTELSLALPAQCTLPRFLDAMTGLVRRDGTAVILLDEIGAGIAAPALDERFWTSLRSLGTVLTRGKLAYIVAGQRLPFDDTGGMATPSPFLNIFGHVLTLGPLEDDEALELIGAAPHPFSAEDVAWILRQSGSWPAILQILCSVGQAAQQSGLSRDTWQAEALRRIAPFRYLLEG